MTTAEIRELTDDELQEALTDAKEEKFNLRFQVATNQLDNTARIREVKQEIARILTVMRERATLPTPAEAPEVGPASTEAAEAGKEGA